MQQHIFFSFIFFILKKLQHHFKFQEIYFYKVNKYPTPQAKRDATTPNTTVSIIEIKYELFDILALTAPKIVNAKTVEKIE